MLAIACKGTYDSLSLLSQMTALRIDFGHSEALFQNSKAALLMALTGTPIQPLAAKLSCNVEQPP